MKRSYMQAYNRVIVNDSEGIFESIKDLALMYQKSIQIIPVDEFISNLPNYNNLIILGYGRDLYDRIKSLHDSGVIHIGLRSFDYGTFSRLPQVYIGTNKLVFSRDITKSWDYPVIDSDGSSHESDIRLAYFFSNSVLRQPLELPSTKCVGLKEGIQILKDTFIPNTTNQIGFDYETNGFPEWEGFDISGFALSIADLGISVFFDYRLDYNYDPANITEDNIKDKQEFFKVFYEFITTHKDRVWAYNCSFEILVLFWMYREFIPIQDSMALCVADDQRGSLKYNVQYYLASPSWDDSLDKQQSYIAEFNEVYNSYTEWESDLVNDSYLTRDYVSEAQRDLVIEGFNLYKDNPEWRRMLKLYWGSPWFACDPTDLGIYCCYDAFYGERLGNYLSPAYKDIEMPDGSIGQGPYKAFLYNRYMGAELKLNGIKVNRDKLSKYKKHCENIIINFEVLSNRVYLDAYFKHVTDTYNNFNISDGLKKLLFKYPYCATINSIDFMKSLLIGMTSDTEEVTANKPLEAYYNIDHWEFPVGELYTTTKGQYISDVINNHKCIPHDLFNDIVGMDISDEISFVDDYEFDGLSALMRKRKLLGYLGDYLMSVLGLSSLITEFNKEALKLMLPKLKEFEDKYSKLWIYHEYIPMNQSYKLADWIDWWKNRKSKTELVILDDLGNVVDSFKDRIMGEFPNIPENMVGLLFKTPQDLLEKLYYYRVSSDNIPDELNGDLSSVIPLEVINSFDVSSYPNINSYREYIYNASILDELSRISSKGRFNEPVYMTDAYGNTSELTMDYLGKLFNYWSPTQFPLFSEMLKKEYLNEVIISRAALEYTRSDYFDRDYSPQSLKKVLVSMEEHLDVILKSGKYDYLGKPDYTWSGDIGRSLENTAGMDLFYLPIYDNDISTSFNNGLGETKLKTIIKLFAFLDLAAAARKEYTTYIVALESGLKKLRYNESPNHDGVGNGKQLNCGQFAEDYIGYDTYLPEFSINTVNTKRCSSGFHTFRHASNSMECLDVEEGRIKTYFDVSQMEPRSLAYISEDANFKGAYEDGKDAYMELAKVTWASDYAAHNYDDEYMREEYRPIAKTCLISKIYGRGNAGLAETAEVPIERVAEMEKALFNNWKDIGKYRVHKMHYLEATSELETYLGDRLRGYPEYAYTQAVNWMNQGNTAVVANEDFENAILHIRDMGIEVWAESIVHDSNTNDIPINKLFECDLAYRRYFRLYCHEKYGIDFKYDLDISKDSCNNMKYKMKMTWVDEEGNTYPTVNVSNRQLPRPENWNPNWKLLKVGTISGNKEDVDYVMKYLEGITIIKDEVEEQESEPLLDFLQFPSVRSHLFCDLPEFRHYEYRSVTFNIDRYVEGEELFGLPLGEPYYFDKIKKWNEHLIPGLSDNEECFDTGESMGIKDNPNKVYPVEIMNSIMARDGIVM